MARNMAKSGAPLGTDGELLATIRLGMNYYTFPRRDIVIDEEWYHLSVATLKEGGKSVKMASSLKYYRSLNLNLYYRA